MLRKWILVLALLALVGLVGGYLQNRGTILPYVVLEVKEGETAPEAQNSELNAYLTRLASMENCPISGIMDSGSLSYGEMCFKKGTYLYFVKRYQIYPQAEEQELLSHLGDSWTQREIVKNIIEEDKNMLAVHWKTTVVKRGLGLPNL